MTSAGLKNNEKCFQPNQFCKQCNQTYYISYPKLVYKIKFLNTENVVSCSAAKTASPYTDKNYKTLIRNAGKNPVLSYNIYQKKATNYTTVEDKFY